LTPKVLVVDDDPECTSALAALLESESFSVQGAIGGYQALEQIEKDQPDLLLTDVRMPGMDGYELLRRVRDRFPRIVVVLMSAEGNLPFRSLREGAQAYVAKPLDIDEVVRTVKTALEAVGRVPETA
jgi:DNA-binding NtrC family response regulator